jgi:type II secretory pathway component GspD/PulD (secretin)
MQNRSRPSRGKGRRIRSVCITRPLIGFPAVAVVALQLMGCAQNPPRPPITSHEAGSFNPPMVISGHTKQDTAAYAASDEKLTEADWRELEHLGPRPVWEELEGHRHRSHRVGDNVCAQTRPTTAPVAIVPAPLLNEADLPVQTIDLPDGKVRLIWRLRSYGGPTVKAGRDPATARRTVEIAPADLTPLVTVLMQNLGTGGTVSPLPLENAVIVTCAKPMRESVLALLNDLDRPTRQVEITAKIFEVSHDFDFQQGTQLLLNRLASNSGQSLTSSFSAKRFLDAMNNPSPAPVQGSVLRLMQVFQSAGVSVDVSFQFLADAGLISVVSEPRMTVAVGQTGYMLAGQEIPIQSETLVNNAITLATTYKPVGVQLYITPQTAGVDRIKLHTISIVSAISGFSPLPTMSGGTASVINPVIDSREAETAVTVDDHSTLVISGLRMIRTTTREEKIPGLGDVPVLGWLFKNHRSQQQQTDLYFFITPTLL